MTSTFTALRQGFADHIGSTTEGTLSFSTTTDIGVGVTVVSTNLRNYGWTDDDVPIGWYIYIVGAVNVQVERRVSDYTGATGTVTVTAPNLAAETGSKTFEMHRLSPTLLKTCLNEGARLGYPYLHVPQVVERLFTARNQTMYTVPSTIIGKPDSIEVCDWWDSGFDTNILESDDDPGFENWSNATALSAWVASGITLAQESERSAPENFMVLRGSYSARCTATASQVDTLLRTLTNGSRYKGQKVNFSIWVYCLTASRVKARIDEDGVTSDSTTAHSGSGWERLTVSRSLGAVSTLKVGLTVSSGAAIVFYADEAFGTAGPSEEALPAGEPVSNWQWRPTSGNAAGAGSIVLPWTLPQDKYLRVRGKGYLTSVSAEADTMEIDAPQTELLYAYAAKSLMRRLSASRKDAEDVRGIKGLQQDWTAVIAEYEKRYAVKNNTPVLAPHWWGG